MILLAPPGLSAAGCIALSAHETFAKEIDMKTLGRLGTAILLGLVLIVTMYSTARANCGDTFRVYNQGSHDIYELYVEPASYNSWGPDLLGTDVLLPNEYVTPISFHWGSEPDMPSTTQDVLAVYSDGTKQEVDNVDICSYNVTFYY
jgi:hypothetical protein